MTWRIWSPVGSTSSSNASFERSFSSDAASALDEKRRFGYWAAVRLGQRHQSVRPNARYSQACLPH
jgi:hypothetical protein